MRTLRPLIFWLHLLSGVVAGVVVLVMSATGVLLTYEKQVVAWADARTFHVTPPAGAATRLPLDSLVAVARAAHAGKPTAVTVRADRAAPVAVAFGREATVFVDPYTGAALGGGATGVREFLGDVTSWHRWLGRSGEGRAMGKRITGACNLAFLVLVITGAYLWIPRRVTWTQVRNVAWFRRGLAGKARDFNWHNVVGLWSALPLLVVVASGVVISYPWASALVYRAVGEQPPAQNGPPAGAPGGAPGGERGGAGARGPESAAPSPSPSPTPLASLDALVARAEGQVPGWRSIQLTLPAAAAPRATLSIDAGTGGQPQKRGTLTLDRATGAVRKWEPFASQSPGRRLRSILRFAHTGEVLGLAGQTIAGLVSLGATLLVWTGLALSLRRFRRWLARRDGGADDEAARAAA